MTNTSGPPNPVSLLEQCASPFKLGDSDTGPISFEDLAREFSIRQEAAAHALDLLRAQPSPDRDGLIEKLTLLGETSSDPSYRLGVGHATVLVMQHQVDEPRHHKVTGGKPCTVEGYPAECVFGSEMRDNRPWAERLDDLKNALIRAMDANHLFSSSEEVSKNSTALILAETALHHFRHCRTTEPVSLKDGAEAVKAVFDLSLVGPDSGFKPVDVAEAVAKKWRLTYAY